MTHVGPCELLVIVFPGTEAPTSATAVLHSVDTSEGVRTVDAIMIVKDGTGQVRAENLTDRRGAEKPTINAADVGDIGVLLAPHSSALALVVEHTWTQKPMEAVRDTGGALVASIRIPVGSGG